MDFIPANTVTLSPEQLLDPLPYIISCSEQFTDHGPSVCPSPITIPCSHLVFRSIVFITNAPPYAPCPGMFVLRPGVMCSSTAVQTLSSAVFRTRVDQLGKPVWGNAAAHGCTPDLLVSTTLSQPMAEESYVALLHDRVHLN